MQRGTLCAMLRDADGVRVLVVCRQWEPGHRVHAGDCGRTSPRAHAVFEAR